PLEPFHDEERLAGIAHTIRDVPDDRGMPELGEHPGLAHEPVCVCGAVPNFDRHGPARRAIGRPENHSHAATAGWPLPDEAIQNDVIDPHLGKQDRAAADGCPGYWSARLVPHGLPMESWGSQARTAYGAYFATVRVKEPSGFFSV